MTLTYRPPGDKLYVRLDRVRETQTEAGVVVPNLKLHDPCVGAPCTGEVVGVGPGAYTKRGVMVYPDVQPGDRILFSRLGASERERVTINGEELAVMAECDVMAVIGGEGVDRLCREFQEI